MTPRRVYAIRIEGDLVGFRRFGHHQDGPHKGEILTSEATPFLARKEGGGPLMAIPVEHEGNPPGIYYTCHRYDGPDSAIIDAGWQIEEMG